jgi:hypothetical protein
MSSSILSRLRLRIAVLSALAMWIPVAMAVGAEARQNTERRTTVTQSDAPHYAGNCDRKVRNGRSEPPRYGDERDFECFTFDEY